MRTKILTLFGCLCIACALHAHENIKVVSTMKNSRIAAIEQSSNNDSLLRQNSNILVDSTKTEIEILVQKIASLEHQLSYLTWHNKLYNLKTDLAIFRIDINDHIKDIKTDLLTQNSNYTFYESYIENYEYSMQQMESFESLIETYKYFYEFELSTYSYTPQEQRVLKACYNSIEKEFSTVNFLMKYYDKVLKVYKDAI